MEPELKNKTHDPRYGNKKLIKIESLFHSQNINQFHTLKRFLAIYLFDSYLTKK